MTPFTKINDVVEFTRKMQSESNSGPFANIASRDLSKAEKSYIVASVSEMKAKGIVNKNVLDSDKKVIWGLLKNTITGKWEIAPLR